MQTDRYTKILLTIIAACLVWIVARDVTLVELAQAQPPPGGIESKAQPVTIVSVASPLPVKVENWYQMRPDFRQDFP